MWNDHQVTPPRVIAAGVLLGTVGGCIALGLIANQGAVDHVWPFVLITAVAPIATSAALLALAWSWIALSPHLVSSGNVQWVRKAAFGFAVVYLLSTVTSCSDLIWGVSQLPNASADWRGLMVDAIESLSSLIASGGLVWLGMSASGLPSDKEASATSPWAKGLINDSSGGRVR